MKKVEENTGQARLVCIPQKHRRIAQGVQVWDCALHTTLPELGDFAFSIYKAEKLYFQEVKVEDWTKKQDWSNFVIDLFMSDFFKLGW